MKKSLIPSNISNLSQLLEDGLVLCNKSGSVLYFNNLAKQYLENILNKKKFMN